VIPRLRSLRFRPKIYRPDGEGFWSGHLPFAADLIDALKPSTFVELGTYYGESYFGFCQAVQEASIDCRCYAVDNWEGDLHTGRYGPSVFENVSANNALYAPFSKLLRMSFKDAQELFSEGTIDLLHLDGCHTYEAVNLDFDAWLPKVTKGGVILMHDIAVTTGDFGVWRFWEEVSRQFPSFAFLHSSGLGVLANGLPNCSESPLLSALFSGTDDPQTLRDYYELC
jgi:hypothetical protein